MSTPLTVPLMTVLFSAWNCVSRSLILLTEVVIWLSASPRTFCTRSLALLSAVTRSCAAVTAAWARMGLSGVFAALEIALRKTPSWAAGDVVSSVSPTVC